MIRRARAFSWIAVALAASGLLAVVLRLAWLSDDAYITLRTVENLLRGHGPVWNVGERVQTFTHPLWFWLVAGARAATGEHYVTTIVLSVALALAAALLLVRSVGPRAGSVLLLACIASRAFGDFATSGLETPLAMLLLVLLVHVDGRSAAGAARFATVAWLTGLLAVTRLDLLVLALPVLVAHARGAPLGRRLRALAVGLSPLFAWTAFAAFYYASPFPITAYAKAFAPGVPAAALWAQGGRYASHTLTHDPVTVLVVVAGIGVGLAWGRLGGRALALGALASCGYVVHVGGDFMAGRFFVPAFVVALGLCGRALGRAPNLVLGIAAAVLAVAAWLPGRPPFLAPPRDDVAELPATAGIIDERRAYYRAFGLFSPAREIPDYGRFTRALRRQGRERPIVLGSGMAGGIPFLAGELFHFVDPWLCDPLLMRLPVVDPADWRIGHFTRAVPDGYPESLAFGGDRIRHEGLAAFYADLRAALRGPLLQPARLAAVGAVLLDLRGGGRRDYVREQYRTPPRQTLALAELSADVPDGTFWFDEPAVRCVPRGGWRIELATKVRPRALRVQATALVRYRFTFLDGAREVGSVELPAGIDPGAPPADDGGDVLGYLRGLFGTHTWPVALPADLSPFDALRVDCVHEPWIRPAIAALRWED